MMRSDLHQLSLLVKPDKRIGDLADGSIVGSLTLSGKLAVYEDFNAGEGLVVTVARPNGEVVAGGTYEVENVATVPIKVKGVVYGTERSHSTSMVDGDMVNSRHEVDPHDPRSDES